MNIAEGKGRFSNIEIGRILNLTGLAVTKCVERGKKIFDENEELKKNAPIAQRPCLVGTT